MWQMEPYDGDGAGIMSGQRYGKPAKSAA